ncbi:MAG: hypothetical protein ACYTBJ_20570, partial [Planctomycetota bacterium]
GGSGYHVHYHIAEEPGQAGLIVDTVGGFRAASQSCCEARGGTGDGFTDARIGPSRKETPFRPFCREKLQTFAKMVASAGQIWYFGRALFSGVSRC